MREAISADLTVPQSQRQFRYDILYDQAFTN